jgi:hypothetical protein
MAAIERLFHREGVIPALYPGLLKIGKLMSRKCGRRA